MSIRTTKMGETMFHSCPKGRRVALMVSVLLGGLGTVGVPVAFASSSVSLCVPSTAGRPVVSDGSGSGACASGASKVTLPASATDQQTLISILPRVSFIASGVGGKPTVRLSGLNVQLVK